MQRALQQWFLALLNEKKHLGRFCMIALSWPHLRTIKLKSLEVRYRHQTFKNAALDDSNVQLGLRTLASNLEGQMD